MQDVKTDRHKFIGGSDVPIIMGISPFKSRYDLLLEKAQLQEDDFEGNAFTEYGNVMEEKIRDYININEKDKFIEGCHEDGPYKCHTDGENETTILEIKTTSQVHDNLEEYQVYLVQMLYYMEHTGRNLGKLCVYERPKNFNTEFDPTRLHIYSFSKSDFNELVETINKEVEHFLDDLKKVKENPFIAEEELLPIELRNISSQITQIEKELEQLDVLNKRKESLKEELYNAMEKYNIKKWKTNNGYNISRVYATEDKQVLKFNESKFKEENKDLYEKYMEEKIQKGKKGYVRISNSEEK